MLTSSDTLIAKTNSMFPETQRPMGAINRYAKGWRAVFYITGSTGSGIGATVPGYVLECRKE